MYGIHFPTVEMIPHEKLYFVCHLSACTWHKKLACCYYNITHVVHGLFKMELSSLVHRQLCFYYRESCSRVLAFLLLELFSLCIDLNDYHERQVATLTTVHRQEIDDLKAEHAAEIEKIKVYRVILSFFTPCCNIFDVILDFFTFSLFFSLCFSYNFFFTI